jgi:hypothetical protein
MNKPNIFLSYGGQGNPERTLKLTKALIEYRSLQEELNQVTKETKSLRQFLSDLYAHFGVDDFPTLISLLAPASNSISLLPPANFTSIKPLECFPEVCIEETYNFQNIPASQELHSNGLRPLQSIAYPDGGFDHVISNSPFYSDCLYNNISDRESETIVLPNSAIYHVGYFKADETFCGIEHGKSVSWEEFQQGYLSYIESSRKERKLRKKSKKARKEIRELRGIRHFSCRVYNSSQRISQRLQSKRINDKSGDEINNLEKNELSRLLMFKN